MVVLQPAKVVEGALKDPEVIVTYEDGNEGSTQRSSWNNIDAQETS